ncbi:MAG: SLAC1 anion channel family protein [Kineosporiaceae bacterium]|nr:SLAC1 anion channel family protein [Kineosporiaceae bacterium]MBK7622222.1 SLAC1 anion channel family protein [Kineosporiaceae bacterium]MBK8074550.1 SLAC1 anion channel family protein [Kineosporiaceae bacterium]
MDHTVTQAGGPASAPTSSTAPPHGLPYLPVTLFASVMGIGGLSLAWRRAARVWQVPAWPAESLFWLASAAFVVVAIAYVAKWVRYPAAARAELRHPIRMAFVPTITIALLILATAGQDLVPQLARVAWWVGAVGHLALTIAVLSAWFGRPDIGLTQVTPAWFIPIVGNVVTPLAAPALGSIDLAWFAFGVGLVFWIALLPLLLVRVLVHSDPLPQKLLPTLAIFAAPPAVAGLSWGVLTGGSGEPSADPIGMILYSATIMFVLLVLAQVGRLRRLPFAMPWWAYTFPSAAAAASAIAMASTRPALVFDVVAVLLLALATVVVAGVTAATVVAALQRRICLPE